MNTSSALRWIVSLCAVGVSSPAWAQAERPLASSLVRVDAAVPTRGPWGEWLRFLRGPTHGTKDLVVLVVILKPGQEPHPPHQQPQIRAQLSNILMAICSQRLVPAIGGGRVVAAEIFIANPAVRNIIREGKSHQLDAVIQTGADQGMQTMDRTLVGLVQAGTITFDEARNYAVDLTEFERLMRG